MNKIIFKGLKLEDYIHPEEKNFCFGAENISLVQEGLDFLNDLSIQLVRQITEGKWVELKCETAPKIFKLLEEVCTILDFPYRPKIFTRHERSLKIIAGGTDYMQILIPDYILKEYSSKMQLYLIGNTISMFKSGHVQLATISSVLCDNSLTAPVRLALMAYLRAADLTSDRGGLLACQNFEAAARCILAETGFPVNELRYLNDSEILNLTEEYILEMSYAESGDSDLLTQFVALLKRVTQDETPPYIRLKELLSWYRSDYQKILFKGVA